MVPTYFRRELRDRALQRHLRLRTIFVSCFPVASTRLTRVSCLPAYPQNLGWMSTLSSAPSKQELRAAALAARDALGDRKRSAAAKALAKRGLPLEIPSGAVVSGYSPIRNEIDPAPLMIRLAEAGARLALPVINARGKSL